MSVLLQESGSKILTEGADNIVLEVVSQIELSQEAWLGGDTRYFQAPPSVVTPPVTSVLPDNLSTIIPDRNISWNSTGVSIGSEPHSIEVTEYLTPSQELGYQIIYKKNAGGVQVKSIGYGPEAAERTFDWRPLQ